MHCNPSYIKWFISSIQANINIETILQKKSNLFLEFCLSNVYNYLSENAKKVASVLLSAQGFKDMPEIAELSNLESIYLQQAIHELMRTNMLAESTKKYTSSVKNTYQLSELARAYLQKNHKPNKDFQQQIRKKLNQLNSLYEEQRQRENRNKYHASNIKLRDKSDRIVVKKLYDSIKYIKNKDYENSFSILEEAQSLAPDYHEVARVRAYYFQVVGDLAEAREQYELSIQLSPNTSQLYFWFGKFISEVEDDMEEAIKYFEKAYSLDKDSIDVGLSLSRGYMILRDFEKAKKY
jgi:Flp pilus assembly protein TadD